MNTYFRLKKISLQEGFDLLLLTKEKRTLIDGHQVTTNLHHSLRLRTFLEKGTKCVTTGCPLEGNFFAIERGLGQSNLDIYHLNLWAVDGVGQEILMTCDHILAQSLGGINALCNTQTMCAPHNFEKSKLESKIRQERKINGTAK